MPLAIDKGQVSLGNFVEADTTDLRNNVEQVYRETRSDIRGYLLCLGVPEAAALETVQEVYLRLWQTLAKGESILNYRAWLFRVAHNLALKVRSREKGFRPAVPDWEKLMDTTASSAEQKLLDRERAAQIHAALDSLSPQQRNCLYLRSEGLRYREIADVMGISLSSVNEFLRRAISRLAEAVRV